jgi:hypothetical protein
MATATATVAPFGTVIGLPLTVTTTCSCIGALWGDPRGQQGYRASVMPGSCPHEFDQSCGTRKWVSICEFSDLFGRADLPVYNILETGAMRNEAAEAERRAKSR